MVIVPDYMEKINSTSGQTFVLHEFSEGLELVQSQNKGNFTLPHVNAEFLPHLMRR